MGLLVLIKGFVTKTFLFAKLALEAVDRGGCVENLDLFASSLIRGSEFLSLENHTFSLLLAETCLLVGSDRLVFASGIQRVRSNGRRSYLCSLISAATFMMPLASI